VTYEVELSAVEVNISPPRSLVLLCCLFFPQDGTTPLYIACQEGYLPVAEQLVAAKAGINTQRKVSCLPYYIIQDVQCLDFITRLDYEKDTNSILLDK